MKELNIPTEHYDKIKFFIELPKEIKNKLHDFFRNAPIGILPSALLELASNSLTDLSKDRINDILLLYFSLTRAKENFEISLDNFIDLLAEALNKSGDEGLKPTEKILEDFRELLSGNKNISITSKVLQVMADNQKTFLDAGTNQDIRAAFDHENNYLGSVIIHNLKILFRENDETKEAFFALDTNDVEKLILTLKKSQERGNQLKEKITSESIIEIKQ